MDVPGKLGRLAHRPASQGPKLPLSVGWHGGHHLHYLGTPRFGRAFWNGPNYLVRLGGGYYAARELRLGGVKIDGVRAAPENNNPLTSRSNGE